VPAQYTAFETGARDPSFPNLPLVIVTSLLRCKFKDDTLASGTDHSEGDTVSPGVEPVPALSAEPAAVPPARKVPDAAVDTFSRPVPIPDGGPIEARLDALEKSIGAKLDLISGGSESQRVVSGVASLAAQVKLRQFEIDAIKRQIEEETRRAGTTVSPAALDGMKRELEELRASNAAMEAESRANEARMKEIQAALGGSASAAQARTRTLIRKMMDSTYQETTATFDERRMYGPDDVNAQLKRVLKERSLECLRDIEQNGLF
jgi:hypothetical protein